MQGERPVRRPRSLSVGSLEMTGSSEGGEAFALGICSGDGVDTLAN